MKKGIKKGALFGRNAPNQPMDAARSGPNWGEIGRNLLGNIGDAISLHYGGQPVFGQQERQRLFFEQQAAQQAEVLRRQSLLQAQRAADSRDLAEYRASQPTAMQRNFDAFQEMDPAQRQNFLQYQDAVNPLGSIGPDGRFYNRPRASQVPTQPVGRLTPIGPTTRTTPAPELSANGFPAQLTQDQYEATVAQMGRTETDDWMRRHNIKVMK